MSTARRTPAAIVPPLGLTLALQVIREHDEPACAPSITAASVYPHALDVVGTALGRENGKDIGTASMEAIKSLWPNLDDEPTNDTAARAGFLVGFAACWLLMTQIGGRQ